MVFPEPKKIYPLDGMELYLDLCDEVKLVPVRPFYQGLLSDVIDLKVKLDFQSEQYIICIFNIHID